MILLLSNCGFATLSTNSGEKLCLICNDIVHVEFPSLQDYKLMENQQESFKLIALCERKNCVLNVDDYTLFETWKQKTTTTITTAKIFNQTTITPTNNF